MRTRSDVDEERQQIPDDGLISRSPAKDAELIEAKRRQIVEGSCTIFFKKGFNPTTIREIAEACNMSVGTLYHYVSSKDEILFLAFKQFQGTWQRNVLQAPEISKIDDPVEQLRVSIELTLRFAAENAKLLQFLFTEAKHLDEVHLRAVMEMDNTEVVGSWERLLRRVNKKKRIASDVNFTANLLNHMITFVALRKWNLKKRSTEENIKLLTDSILKMLGITTKKNYK